MPFVSKSQQRFFYAAEAKGELPKGTAKEWQDATPKGKKLPEHVKKKASLGEEAAEFAIKLANEELRLKIKERKFHSLKKLTKLKEKK